MTYSLGPGAPAGVTINAATGVLAWPTAAGCICSPNIITVRVTQTTSPNLSDAKSFTVIVSQGPTLQPLRFSYGVAQLTWNAIAGQRYRVQRKSSLSAGTWTDLLPDTTASGATASATYFSGSGTQGYYRVMALP